MWELKKEIENRKENLIFTLKNKKGFMELEKQHQIYGAIKELNHVLSLMEQCREEEMMSKPKHLQFSSDEEEEEEDKPRNLKVVSEKIRKFKIPIRIRLAKNDA